MCVHVVCSYMYMNSGVETANHAGLFTKYTGSRTRVVKIGQNVCWFNVSTPLYMKQTVCKVYINIHVHVVYILIYTAV